MSKRFKEVFLAGIKFMIAATTWAKARGVKLIVGGSLACTNGKVVYLPTLPDDDKALIVKARGYADHEASHIEETDFSIPNSRWRGIFEDVRVEKCRVKKYPGSAINLKELVDILVAEGKFTAPKTDLMGMLLMAAISRTRAKFLKQMALLPNAIKAEKFCRKTFGDKFTDKLFSIVDRVDHAKSTTDCKRLADEVEELIGKAASNPDGYADPGDSQKDPGKSGKSGKSSGEAGKSDKESGKPGEESGKPEKSNQSSDGSDKSGKGSENPGESGKPEGTAPSSEGSGDSSEESGKPEQADQSSDGSGKSDGSGQSSEGSGQPDNTPGDPGGSGAGGKTKNLRSLQNAEPTVETDLGKILEKDLNKAAQKMHGEPKFPTTVYPSNRPCSSQKSIAARAALVKSRQLSAQLAGLFAAHNAKHCGTRENGQRLSAHRLHLLAVDTPDKRVFTDRRQRKAENTAIALLIDASASMDSHIGLAVQAAYVVAKCLQTMKGIVTTVAAFPHGNDEQVLEVKPFNLPPVFDRFGQVYANNNTPTAEVVMWGIQRLFPRKEERKMMIIFTDGRPNNYHTAKRAVEKAMSMGIEVYVIALNDPHKSRSSSFIDEDLVSPIAKIEDLGPAIIKLLRKALIERAA